MPSVVTVSHWSRSVGFGSVLKKKLRFSVRFGFLRVLWSTMLGSVFKAGRSTGRRLLIDVTSCGRYQQTMNAGERRSLDTTVLCHNDLLTLRLLCPHPTDWPLNAQAAPRSGCIVAIHCNDYHVNMRLSSRDLTITALFSAITPTARQAGNMSHSVLLSFKVQSRH